MTDRSSSRRKTRKPARRRPGDRAGPAARRWGKIAYRWILAYAQHNRKFIGEECTQAARAAGIASPHDLRAWGWSFRKAAREGVIRPVGYAPSPLRHCAPTIVWESAAYREPPKGHSPHPGDAAAVR